MRKILTFVCVALLMAGLCGCEKPDMSKLEGTWSEQYAPSVFAMDVSVEYTFDGNNNYQLHTYDALGGESHDYSGRYAIDLINAVCKNFDLADKIMSVVYVKKDSSKKNGKSM